MIDNGGNFHNLSDTNIVFNEIEMNGCSSTTPFSSAGASLAETRPIN
jgi:hypothetical protein